MPAGSAAAPVHQAAARTLRGMPRPSRVAGRPRIQSQLLIRGTAGTGRQTDIITWPAAAETGDGGRGDQEAGRPAGGQKDTIC